jgi:hypothetical protein
MFLGDPDPDPLVRGAELRLMMMYLCASMRKKCEIFFASLKSIKKGVGSGVGSGYISQRYGSGDPDPHPHHNVTDPQHFLKVNDENSRIRIRVRIQIQIQLTEVWIRGSGSVPKLDP